MSARPLAPPQAKTVLRWRPYNGDRIAAPGVRAIVARPGDEVCRGGYTCWDYRYACVWPEGDGTWGAYVERHDAGCTEDVPLGPFATAAEAKAAVARHPEPCVFAQHPHAGACTYPSEQL